MNIRHRASTNHDDDGMSTDAQIRHQWRDYDGSSPAAGIRNIHAAATNQSLHSPGPWSTGGSLVLDGHGRHIAMVLWRRADGSVTAGATDMSRAAPGVADHDANRCLIAAAPDLLAALKAFRDGGPHGGSNFVGWHDSYGPAIALANAAIAKAEPVSKSDSAVEAPEAFPQRPLTTEESLATCVRMLQKVQLDLADGAMSAATAREIHADISTLLASILPPTHQG